MLVSPKGNLTLQEYLTRCKSKKSRDLLWRDRLGKDIPPRVQSVGKGSRKYSISPNRWRTYMNWLSKCDQARDRPCNHCSRRYPPPLCIYESDKWLYYHDFVSTPNADQINRKPSRAPEISSNTFLLRRIIEDDGHQLETDGKTMLSKAGKSVKTFFVSSNLKKSSSCLHAYRQYNVNFVSTAIKNRSRVVTYHGREWHSGWWPTVPSNRAHEAQCRASLLL